MTQQHNTTPEISVRFNDLGVLPQLLKALETLRLTVPTPIQRQSIPVALEGKDIVGIAQTGTGKTLAFGIPMIQRLGKIGGRGLVIAPTRELALQIDETFRNIGRTVGLRTAVLIGGASLHLQRQMLAKKPHVVIATPGRLIDHLHQRNIVLSDTRILVLDEADRMFDMGFAPQINEILKSVPTKRQTMLFSATMPQAILDIASRNMALPVRIEIAPSGTSPTLVEQEIWIVKKEAKQSLLQKMLSEHHGAVLVFSRTKYGARKICVLVRGMGHTVSEIHSERSLGQRREALAGFKSGRYRVLVATDIAARGIDVQGIELVVNYDLPDEAENYVHRIGRTGRAGVTGKAISFAMPDQGNEVRAIERLVRKTLEVKTHEGAQLQAHGRIKSFAPRHGGFGKQSGFFGHRRRR
mgnify:CR=1 FL=1